MTNTISGLELSPIILDLSLREPTLKYLDPINVAIRVLMLLDRATAIDYQARERSIREQYATTTDYDSLSDIDLSADELLELIANDIYDRSGQAIWAGAFEGHYLIAHSTYWESINV